MMPNGTLEAGAAAREGSRKALHLSTAILPLIYAKLAPREVLVATLVVASFVALLVEWARRSLPGIRAAFERAFGSMLRGREHSSVTGATWLAISCLAAVVFLPRPAAVSAMWCVTVGDTAATVVGRWWVRKRQRSGRAAKSAAGSLAMFAASVVGVWWLTAFSPWRVVVIAAAAVAGERPSGGLDDNARIVAVAGAVAYALT